jgi:hypothetical protein
MLKIVNNNGEKEIHSVFIDDGSVTVVDIETGENVSLSSMEELFPNFIETIQSSLTTAEVITNLSLLNDDYQWAHVSGSL